ncbi:hypothetical protein COCC4DRAFT_67863 [Bipolaris maydis ATCC 48331]|uniref:UBA domain-containing protein n=1 Tax=Cochliobolus heterostrophus (strain C4 / ATCC 48331 / race T) TaxID=665024 RepID=N4XX33_COCH4|nr:uncharacterized protein COCC4DRAFT_67863 [Bipolaris maydis ATCC 48331]ENI10956.1 hypothetical protein COCC4DRAFT_67863 [Bipolaris maydis ATCC 48331]KAJ5030781.1 hypothetical protein J3E73DRAFT_429526 [Bipolaris maydis]KAJ6274383.1 hypothetical protein PSV08DRAFT_383829 [Bipolaris maydis]
MVKRRMLLLLRGKNSKSATTLRAVPANPENQEDVQHSGARELAIPESLFIDNIKLPSSITSGTTSPTKSTTIWRKKHIAKPTGTKRASKKSKSFDSQASIIGTYKDGKIQWQRRGEIVTLDSNKDTKGTNEQDKSKMPATIPSGRCNQPLPPLPFFESTFGELRSRYSISPPLAGDRFRWAQSQAPLTSQHSKKTSSQTSPAGSPKPRHRKGAAGIVHTSTYSCSVYSQESEVSSLRSDRSSETSFEADNPSKQGKPDVPINNNEGQRKAPPTESPRRYVHQPSNSEGAVFRATHGTHATCNTPHSAEVCEPKIEHKSSKRNSPRRRPAPSPRLVLQTQATHHSETRHSSVIERGPCSPTLSEAECDLHQQLASFESIGDLGAELDQDRTPLAEGNLFQWNARQPSPEGDNVQMSLTELAPSEDLSAPPPLPRKSSKRQPANRNMKLSRLPHNHIASQVRRERSKASKTLTLIIPKYRRTSADMVLSQVSNPRNDANAAGRNTTDPIISPAGAESLILNILQNLSHFDDLFAAAFVNHGFYRVFKRHELGLIKSTLRAMSPPAWEFREIAFPGHDSLHAHDLEMTRPEEEYSPTSYLQLQKQDIQVIRAIKLEILEKCQSFVRPEISVALMSTNPSESARVDDALWRIWSFCTIFGSGKGREDDVVAQMDWLNGGTIAHQETCTFSISGTDFMNDTLVGASESFGKGNEGGLSAEQLFDIMELWNCLGVLLQSFEGRTVQARQAGIYDDTEIRGGDIDGEEMMLDEWCYYLMTFGPAAVLKLTGPYHPSDPKGFTIAAENGWINWKPPTPGNTRRKFLREAASRIYEDKIANTYAKISTRDVQREQSKMRIQKHINELHQRKISGETGPMISMSQERPMSDWDTVLRNLTRPPIPKQGPIGDIITHVPGLKSSVSLPNEGCFISELPATRTPSPTQRIVARPLLPTPAPSTIAALDQHSVVSCLPCNEENIVSPQWRTAARPLLPSPSISTCQSNRDLYTLDAISSIGSPPRRMIAEPLLPTPSTTTASNTRDWQAGGTGISMPPILEDAPSHHPLSPIQARPNHPVFHQRKESRDSDLSSSASPRSAIFQQHERQHSIYSSASHEHTAEKAIYRIVEMGFTPEQAREALRMTDLGTGLRVDCAVELLLSRQA